MSPSPASYHFHLTSFSFISTNTNGEMNFVGQYEFIGKWDSFCSSFIIGFWINRVFSYWLQIFLLPSSNAKEERINFVGKWVEKNYLRKGKW